MNDTDSGTPLRLRHRRFGRLPEGGDVEELVLMNARGMEVRAIAYGCIITALRVPDRHGRCADVVHGFDTLEPYLQRHPYFGAVIGRFANRIAGAAFTIDGETYRVTANHGAHHLHGGVHGFDRKIWSWQPLPDVNGVLFSATSEDGEEGYPGRVRAEVTYALTDAGALVVTYHATTDRATHVNLTQHSYFNLAGHDAGDVLSHELTLFADRYTPVDASLIPTGEMASVDGTPLDFRRPAAIGARIDDAHPQLQQGRGYDHNFVLNAAGAGLVPAARLTDPESGRALEVLTSEPGLQVYSGNLLDGRFRGKDGVKYQRRSAICLETQHYPDAPNKPHFPSTLLRPGESFRSRTVFRFGVMP